MPFFVKVEQLNPSRRPNSENVVFFGKNGIFKETSDMIVDR
jgi:hypothetical protein